MKGRAFAAEGVCARVGLAIVGLQVLISFAISLLPNPEGWFGGVLYFGLFALPLLVLSLGLLSHRPRLVTGVGVVAALFVLFYAAVVIATNWSGWDNLDAWLILLHSVPAVVGCLVVAYGSAAHLRGGLQTSG